MKILCWMILEANIFTLSTLCPLNKTRLSLSASFLFFCLLLISCSSSEPARDSHQFSGNTMGTQYHITIVADEGQVLENNQQQLQLEIDAELVKINQIMSTYIPDSELMQFNDAPIDEVQVVSSHLMIVFDISRMVSQRSLGAFDITVAPLVDLWGFGPNMQPDQVPTDAAIENARNNVGYEYLVMNHEGVKRTRDIQVDLSAVAKGYGVDWIIDFLTTKGFVNALVEIGGEVRTVGVSVRGTPWRIAVEQPELTPGAVRSVLDIDNLAIATSGDYRNYFEVEGVRFSHTIDPFTGKPITHKLASVTVIDNTAAFADAWATALNVLGPEKAMALAESEHLAAYMIIKTDSGFSDWQSTAFKQLIH